MSFLSTKITQRNHTMILSLEKTEKAFVNVVKKLLLEAQVGVISNFVYTLKAIEEQKAAA